ncbi:hypothetical protein [Bernardetia sp.]|uniref:fluoroquinolone export ABC transporter permease subunit n=1 Tax=Bernardetia sp. TaxID=1937974 RepID=UPI0025C46C64|nr:hypothetical protein [Bernardetia sp.]
MKKILKLTLWELTLQARQHIITIVAVITLIYSLAFTYFGELPTKFIILLISTDPTMLGFLFIGVLILFEKGSKTIEAVVVTPIKKSEYLFAKIISLTGIALVASLIMAFTSQKDFNLLVLSVAVLLSSTQFLLIGFIGVSRIQTVNQYIFTFPFLISPLMLPLLNFFEFTDSLLLYIFPFQACLLLFEAAFEPILLWQWIYVLVYLPLSTIGFYFLALKFYDDYLIQN